MEIIAGLLSRAVLEGAWTRRTVWTQTILTERRRNGNVTHIVNRPWVNLSPRPPAYPPASRNSWTATRICFKCGMLWKSVESLRLSFIPDYFIGIREEYAHFCVNLELKIRSEKKSSGTLHGSIPGLTDMKTLPHRKQLMCRRRCSLRQLFFSRTCSS